MVNGWKSWALALVSLAVVACDDDAAPPGSQPDLSVAGGDLAGAEAGVPPVPLARFAVIGDFGVDTADEAKVAGRVRGWHPDYVVTVGDNNYPSGETATIDVNIGQHYGEFIGMYQGKYGTGSPTNRFWPCLGNHDWYAMTGAQPYLDYLPAL